MYARTVQFDSAAPPLPKPQPLDAGGNALARLGSARGTAGSRASAAHCVTGTATIEFIVLAPFILLTMALVWDLREYVSHHTEIAREMYVAAEVIANEANAHPVSGAGPVGEVMRRAIAKLSSIGAGTVAAAVVTRGTIPVGASTTCNLADDTCLPMVRAAWPPAATPEEGTWADANGKFAPGGHCSTFAPRLPSAGAHFPADVPVLPNEVPADVIPPPAQEAWISRTMRPREWWVVVDSCLHPDGGLFGNVVLGGLQFFDTSDSDFVLRKRAVWASVHDISNCNWC